MLGTDYNLVTNVSQLAAGDIVVISTSGGTTATTTENTNSKKNAYWYGFVASTGSVAGGKLTALGTGTAEYTLSKSGSYWILTCSSGYVGSVSTEKLRYGTGTNTWTIDVNTTTYVASIASTDDASRKLQFNSDRFRTYTSSQTSVYLFKKAASCTSNATVSAGSNSAVTSTTATVSCSGGITSLGSAGCSISSYGFVIGSSANPAIGGSGVTKHEVGTTYTTTGTSFSKNLTGLTPGTTYYVRPYATNGNGTGYGTQTSFTMLNVYTLTFKEYVGGAAASGSPSTGTVVQNATSFSYGATPPSKTGYTIEGFYTNTSASSGVKVANSSRGFGASVDGWTNSSSQYTKGANANLYINWSAKTTAITLNKNNSDASGSTAGSASYTYGESTKNSYAAATRTGYTLNGYYTSTSAGTKILNADGSIAGSSIVVSTVTYTDGSGNWAYDNTALTLYAQWTIKNYTVTWKVNGEDYTAGTPTDNVNHGSHVTTLPTAPSTASYCGDKFMGWTDATDGAYVHGTSNLYTKASEFPNATTAQTFYAVFADYTTD